MLQNSCLLYTAAGDSPGFHPTSWILSTLKSCFQSEEVIWTQGLATGGASPTLRVSLQCNSYNSALVTALMACLGWFHWCISGCGVRDGGEWVRSAWGHPTQNTGSLRCTSTLRSGCPTLRSADLPCGGNKAGENHHISYCQDH